MARLPERIESLWLLAAPPSIWAAHFMLSYITAAVWCAKIGGSLAEVRTAIGVYTAVALIGIGLTSWRGLRRHQSGEATVPHDFDSPEDRYRFLGFASLLLSALSFVATIYVALVAIFNKSCIG